MVAYAVRGVYKVWLWTWNLGTRGGPGMLGRVDMYRAKCLKLVAMRGAVLAARIMSCHVKPLHFGLRERKRCCVGTFVRPKRPGQSLHDDKRA